MLLTSWLSQATDSMVLGGLPVVIPALIFVVFNLHHYAIDSVIWRSGGDHVTRIGRGPKVAAAEHAPAATDPVGPTAATASFA